MWFKNNIKAILIGFATMILGGVGTYLIVVFNKGLDAEKKEFIKEVVIELVESRDFMENNVMGSDYMKKKQATEKLKTISIITQKVDSNQIDYFGILSEKTGLTKTALVDSLAERVGENRLTERQVVELIRKYNRRMVRL